MRGLSSQLAHWSSEALAALGAAGRWWLAELLAIIPGRVSDWLIERGERNLLLAVGHHTISFQLLTDRRRLLTSTSISQADYSPDHIDVFLRSNRLQRAEVAIGIRMPANTVFLRRLLLPIEVARSLDAIVVQDMIAKTPFRLDDVFHAHAARRIEDRIQICQWIVRRKHVDSMAQTLGVELSAISFIEPEMEDDQPPLPIPVQPAAAPRRRRWINQVTLCLAITAPLLGIAAAGLRFIHQQEALDALDVEVAAARIKAQPTLAAMNSLERDKAGLHRIRTKRSTEPGLLDVWEEITRLLPAHSWLTELRMTDTGQKRQVIVTGFSHAAASLVPVVERSALFGDASLVAPISFDQSEDRERFAIQANVRGLDTTKSASR